MKKIISIVAILLCLATTQAQETKPTKQETMDWIAGKIKNNIGGYDGFPFITREFISYISVDGIITIKENAKWDDDIESTMFEINLNKITSYNRQKFTITLNGVEGLRCEIDGLSIKCTDKISVFMKTTEGHKDRLIEFENELNLEDRFFKAIDNLIEYNKSKLPKEKF